MWLAAAHFVDGVARTGLVGSVVSTARPLLYASRMLSTHIWLQGVESLNGQG